jgi:glutamyl-tRNA synthetase
LFNWLFARQNKGAFILRIEDTDLSRSTDESIQEIIEAMKWLGLDWDEGPFRQMERQELYKKTVAKLLEEGKAYRCYCSQEELDSKRQEAQKQGHKPKYDGKCRNLKDQPQGLPFTVRFKTPPGSVTINDMLRGAIEFDNSELDDLIIQRTDGTPIYNFVVVVDDTDMKVTHVIRGDDHLSNTPRQILIYEALGWGDFVRDMRWAHLSMILGPDGTRLSKRHGATSIEEYEKLGYLPEAMTNYLALLGWSTEDSQQIFKKGELVEKFSLERCGKSPAIFDPQKFLWMNGEIIRRTNIADLTNRSIPFLREAGLIKEEILSPQRFELIRSCVALEQEKIKQLTDVPRLIDFLLEGDFKFDEKSVEKVLKAPGMAELLTELCGRLKNLTEFTASSTEKLARDFAAEKGLKTGAVFHPLRVATSGRTQGPSLFHYLEVLGKEKTIRRIEKTCSVLAVH